jgi:arginase
VPYYLGRRDEVFSLGPPRLASAIGGDTVIVDEPRGFSSEIGASFDVIRALASVVHETVAGGRFPLVLAVNCFTAVGTVAGLRRDIGVIWFDAHADFHTPDTSETGFLDGMGLALLLGEGWRELRRTVEGLRPISAEHILLVGVRDVDPSEEEPLAASGIRRADADAVEGALEDLRQRVDTVYVHVDLDVLDPSVARVNTYAADGGFSAGELERALAAISTRFEIAAAAMTAYDPSLDPEGRVPRVAAALASRITPTAAAAWKGADRHNGQSGVIETTL